MEEDTVVEVTVDLAEEVVMVVEVVEVEAEAER
jgi:hypothetical protein